MQLISRKFVGTMHYLPADFKCGEKPKGGPLEIKFFLLRGVNERGWRGVMSLLKPPLAFIINKKINFLNLLADNA